MKKNRESCDVKRNEGAKRHDGNERNKGEIIFEVDVNFNIKNK